MDISSLKNAMISISEFKQQISDIIAKGITKIIVKNNKPVSVILPYDKYIELTNSIEDRKVSLNRIGQEITLNNGVQIMVCVETPLDAQSKDEICIKMYKKMKTSGDLSLHHSFIISAPRVEQVLTNKELQEYYLNGGDAK